MTKELVNFLHLTFTSKVASSGSGNNHYNPSVMPSYRLLTGSGEFFASDSRTGRLFTTIQFRPGPSGLHTRLSETQWDRRIHSQGVGTLQDNTE